MCRLFGAIANQPINADYLLSAAPRSLLKQSQIDVKRKQPDGWGIGWFAEGNPRIFKSPRPMFQEKGLVKRAAAKARGRIVIGHVRWASNPLKLKRAELIGMAHTQPFVHGKWLFAHNGTLFIPKEVAAALGPWKKYLKGKNDSEVLFYWILKHLRAHKHPIPAVRAAIRGLHRVWETCKKSYPIHAYPYHGLNWVLSDGKRLIALCYTDPKGFGKSKALADPKDRYYQLRRQITDHQVVVASEPLDDLASWQKFSHGELLIVRRDRRRLRWHRTRIL